MLNNKLKIVNKIETMSKGNFRVLFSFVNQKFVQNCVFLLKKEYECEEKKTFILG